MLPPLAAISLKKTRVECVAVFLGYSDSAHSESRGALAGRVCRRLLSTSRVAANDILDPESTRAAQRDMHGRVRPSLQFSPRRDANLSARAPQQWDSERVRDYLGLWCDRLLLGAPEEPSRAAILEPRVPYDLQGEAVQRVAQSLPHLTRDQVLLVAAFPYLPLGIVRLTEDFEEAYVPYARHGVSLTVERALQTFRPSPSGSGSAFTLLIGVGEECALSDGFSRSEEARVEELIVPLCVFAASLWTVNPRKAAEYVAQATQDVDTLCPRSANKRLWKSMTAAMLSTRDTALLSAYFEDKPLDPRLSEQHQIYLAETLLRRLHEKNDRE